MRIGILVTFIVAVFAIYFSLSRAKLRALLHKFIPAVVVINALTLLGIALFKTGNLPIMDAWDDIYLFGIPFSIDGIRNSTGGHVLVVSRVLTYLVGNFTHFNFRALIVLQWFTLLVISFEVARLFEMKKLNYEARALAWVAVGLVFSPVNANFCLDPRLLQHIMALAWALIAVDLFRSSRTITRHGITPLICALATLTSAWGLVTWPAFLWPVLSEVRKKPLIVLPWLVLSVLSIRLYAHWFQSGYGDAGFITPGAIALGVSDFFVLLGTYVYPAHYIHPFYTVAMIGGIAVLTQFRLVADALRSNEFRKRLKDPAAIILSYSVLGALLATVSRAKFYPFASQDMRYNMLAVGFFIALALQFARDTHPRFKRYFIAIAVSSFLIGYAHLIHSARHFHNIGSWAEACLKSPQPYADFTCYEQIFSDIRLPKREANFREIVEFMRKNHLALFAGDK